MKFTEKMQSAINEQIALEMFSANLYLSMSAHYASAGLDGFAHWYYVQYREELGHAEDMMKYSIERGGKVRIQAIPAVETDFASRSLRRPTPTSASCPPRSRSSYA